MSASEFQRHNLKRMTDFLTRSSDAQILAHSLWQFFEFRLTCRFPQIDKDQASYWHIDIEQFVESHKPGDLAPQVVVRDTPRREEALLHELLHLNLIPLGYPRFRIWEKDEVELALAEGIINNADHAIMLPIFLSLGYAENRFLSAARAPTPLGDRVRRDIEKLAAQVVTPKGYGRCMSDYLESHSIRHEAVWIAELILGREV